MQPVTVLILVTCGLVLYLCISGLVGHWLGKALNRARRHAGNNSVVKFATSYIPWSVLAGVLICVIVIGSGSGPLVPLVAFGPFLVSLFVAESLEPVVKKCTKCGK